MASPISAGEVLAEEFLHPLGITGAGLARAINVPAGRVTALIRNRRPMTPDLAVRLSIYFGTSI